MLINSKKFNFNFFLSGRKEVNSLESGAIENGGATKINNKIYSNVEGNSNIIINNNNSLSIYIPTTYRTNKQINNAKYVNFSIDYLNQLYTDNNSLVYENTQGSWFSEDLNKVVIEDITIITINLKQVTSQDIKNFKTLASFIECTMVQEGVSIAINSSLAII